MNQHPGPDQVCAVLAFPSDSTIIAESIHDDLYLAIAQTPDHERVECIVFRLVDGVWVRLDESQDRAVSLAVGRDPGREGLTLPIRIGDHRYEEQVSRDGYWAFVASVSDRDHPDNWIKLPSSSMDPNE
jgi:hypothetical protein